MSKLENYRGLEVPDQTPDIGGQAIKDNFKQVANWHPQSVWNSDRNPNSADDAQANWYAGSRWFNNVDKTLWLCVDSTPGAAVWQLTTVSPSGADTQVQFNDSGAFGASANLTFDSTTGALGVTGQANVDNLRLDANTLSSTNTDGDIALTPNGAGKVVLDSLNWPAADGTSGQFIKTDGAGNLAFDNAPDTSPSGSDTQVQFNDSGAFGASASLTFDSTTGALGVTGQANVDNLRLDANTLSSTNTDGDIALTPNGAGKVVLDSLNWPAADGTSGQFIKTDGAGNLSFDNVSVADDSITTAKIQDGAVTAAKLASGISPTSQFILLQDQKTSGTDGGTFSSGAWQTRDINTVVIDEPGACSVSSNQFTLAAGTYRYQIRCPAFRVGRHQARLQNINDSTTVAYGSGTISLANGAYAQTDSWIMGQFTIAVSKTFELQHYSAQTRSGDGFGNGASFGGQEVFTTAEFYKVG